MYVSAQFLSILFHTPALDKRIQNDSLTHLSLPLTLLRIDFKRHWYNNDDGTITDKGDLSVSVQERIKFQV